jgi:Ca-activated chloride channel family protein
MARLKHILLPALLILLLAGPALADGFIIIPRPPHPRPPRPHFHPFPLEVKYHHVDVSIDDRIAVTSIDQEFFNPTRHRLEGYYLFPIPRGAVIKKFSMFIDGKETPAELLDAKKARKIYEDIVRRMRDPALLEYSDTGVFKVRIFPIEPNSTKRVKISYRQVLPKDDHTIEYIYPLNTEKFSAKPLKDVSVKVDIKANDEIRAVYCPTHKVEVSRKGKTRAVVGYEEMNVKPDIDFKLYYSVSKEEMGISLLTYKPQRKDGYFFLGLSPGIGNGERIVEKDIAFVLDVSGSMAGKKMEQAKKALRFCIANLNRGDRFDIIRFSTEAEALFERLATANKENRQKAEAFIDDLQAIGGTNIEEAMTLALGMKSKSGRPYMIIFLTDGKPTIGETQEEPLLKAIKKANTQEIRVFTFGIGNQINTHLLDKISEMTRSVRSYITPDEDIEIKVSNFYTKVQSPVLTDLKLVYPGGVRASKVYPRQLPDLFRGSTLTVLGRYTGDLKGSIVLEGKQGDRRKRYSFKIGSTNGETNDFLAPLWAARRVGYLLDQIRLHGESKEVVDEITDLARTHGIITPYTSYLIVEDEKERVARRQLHPHAQTIGGVTGQDRAFEDRNKMEYSGMSKKSGAPSVRSSEEIQQLNRAENYFHVQTGKERLDYRDREGNVQNVAQQMKNVWGRAFYNTNNVWVDSAVQAQKNQTPQRIQFASREYFDLLRKYPKASLYLALGNNVRFVMDNQIFEIYE